MQHHHLPQFQMPFSNCQGQVNAGHSAASFKRSLEIIANTYHFCAYFEFNIIHDFSLNKAREFNILSSIRQQLVLRFFWVNFWS